MQISFRHSNYKAILSRPNDDENLIHDFVQPDNPLPSNHPILKCVTSKTIIRPALAADDSDFYDDDYRDDEELTIFDGDDEELTEFDGDDEELIVFDEENVTSYGDGEDPGDLTTLDEDNTAPLPINSEEVNEPVSPIQDEENLVADPVLTAQNENQTDNENRATTTTFYRYNPNKVSNSDFQQCSYWNK